VHTFAVWKPGYLTNVWRYEGTGTTDINELISMALEHSGHRLKRKNLLSMLTNGELFSKDHDISHLSPVYDISAYEIQEYLKSLIG